MTLYYQYFPSDGVQIQTPLDSTVEPNVGEVKLGAVLESTPIIIIPGLFGSVTNWRSFAKTLSADSRTNAPVIVIDQRNHGKSAHYESHSYADMVQDLIDFLDYHVIDKAIVCGHSMGGKAAMMAALLHPERVEQLIVLDIAPVTYEHSHAPFLKGLLELDLSTLHSRKQAQEQLVDVIPDTATRLFMLQNLAGSEHNYFWRINLAVLLEYMPQIVGFPDQLLADKQSNVPSLFVNGGLADYLTDEHHPEIKRYFPNATFVEVAQAGHWLHVQQPKAVMQTIIDFIK